ncbi:MAG: GNAT family N-acetyltransferase [Anaerolineales bacterium]|nr:GNAT family N-acetyltransferase [Anaerolineales bacterium]
MTARLVANPYGGDGLQPLDIARHLAGVADLISLCFSPEVEEGWQHAIRELRFLSRLGPLAHMLARLDPQHRLLTQGFVWVDDGRVIGNVSTQPSETSSGVWVIANVAVHPDFRRQGIAQQLMQATLGYIRARGGRQAILQVDDENAGAIRLYQRLGFEHTATHRTWQRSGRAVIPAYEPSRFEIRLRERHEWMRELNLAQLARPEGLSWNRPLSVAEFRPSLLRRLEAFFNGEMEEHWLAVTPQEQIVGALIIVTGLMEGDRLTVLAHPAFRGRVERALLIRGLRRLGSRPWNIHLEHPLNDTYVNDLLRDFSFTAMRTLHWMKLVL